MNIPQPVLSVIEELLFDPVSLTLKNRDHLKWFAVNDGLCACLLTAPQDNAAWYVYPIMQEFLARNHPISTPPTAKSLCD